MGWFLIIVLIILIIVGAFFLLVKIAESSTKQNIKQLNSLAVSIPDFTTTKTIADLDNRFVLLIDEDSKKVCIVNGYNKTIVDYDKILSVEYIENGNTIAKKSTLRTVGGAIVGGVLAGSTGAIIGGLSGSSKSVSQIKSIVIKIMLRDIKTPSIEILAFDCSWTVERKPVSPDNILCTVHAEPAKQIVDTLSVIIDEVDRSGASTTQNLSEGNNKVDNISIADEIKKLANLRDEGILTQEEFERKKTTLLS